MHGAPLYPYLEALRLALIERAEFREENIPAALTEIVRPCTLSPEWFAAFQDTMTAVIPKYLNHTVGTNFDNFDNFSNWDEATILAAIGAASRIEAPSPRPHDVGADWVLQQYKLINMLQCIDSSTFYNIGYSISFYGTQYREGGRFVSESTFPAAIAACRAELAAASWENRDESIIGQTITEKWSGCQARAFQTRRHFAYTHQLAQNADIFSFLWSGTPSSQIHGNGGTLAPYDGKWHLFKTDLNVAPNVEVEEDYESPGPDDLEFYTGEIGDYETYIIDAGYDSGISPVLVARPQFAFKDW